jgi:DNA-binding LacI/PurR family transcriptional regulator
VLRELNACGKPVVMLARVEANGLPNINSVTTDDFMIGYLKADCLLGNGHERIGYISNEPDSPAILRQREGMQTAFLDHGVAPGQLISSSHDVVHWEYTGHAACKMTKELLEEHPELTALITDSMPGGFGALRALHEVGLSCPDDISVITSMSHAGFEELITPALTAVDCSPQVHLEKAIDIVVNPEREHERAIAVGVKLIERESVRCLNQNEHKMMIASAAPAEIGISMN